MSSKIASSFALYSTRTKRIRQARLPQVSHAIRHSKKTRIPSEIDYNTRTLFGTHKTHVLSEIDYKSPCSIRQAHKTHMLSKANHKSRTLFGTHRNVHVKKDCLNFRTIFGAHRKRTCQERLTTSLALF